MQIINLFIVILLVALSGLFSGLTLGLLSLNTYELKRKIKLGSKEAKSIYPLRKNGNQLLCTLLLGNVAVNTTLSIFLGNVASGIIGGIIATGLIVILGEIIPQAVISRHALKFGAKVIGLVYLFYFLLYPLTKPISFFLDKALGGELQTIYDKKELKLILEEHKTQRTNIEKNVIELMQKGLELSEKRVQDVMTPRIHMYALRADQKITPTLLEEIRENGHSRIPVFRESRDKLVGILYSKDLIDIEADGKKTIQELMRKNIKYVKHDDYLNEILKLFKKEKTHLFPVKDRYDGITGIITLEDVLEEVVGEIIDEFDQFKDMRDLSRIEGVKTNKRQHVYE